MIATVQLIDYGIWKSVAAMEQNMDVKLVQI